MSAEPTEKDVMSREVTEQVIVRALIGHGRSVSLDVEAENVYLSLHLEINDARALAVALSDAANAAEK